MKITAISANSWQLTRQGWMNCYLVRETDGLTLIDSTMAGAEQDILKAAKELGAPIKRLLLTHAHVDHVGSVDALAQLLPGMTLAASERSIPLLERPPDKSLRPGEPKEAFGGGLPGILTPVTHLVGDGELFGSLRVVATPGHIPGHLAFLDERDHTMFAGDELTSIGRLAICGWTPWYFPFPSFIMWSKRLALESARRMLDLEPERYACGHGKLVGGGPGALETLIRAASA